MAVRPDQLVYRAGGAALERYGTLRKRTAGFEEVVETWARASTAAEFDRNGVLRLCQAAAVRVSFVDLDGDDVRETLAVPMEGALTQLVEHAIPGGSEADFELVQLDGVTNLAAEYAVRIEAGDDLRYTVPANFDPNNWTASFLIIPDFASNTGVHRFLAGFRVDINNRIEVLQYTGSSDISVEVTANGASPVSAARTCPWSAGDVVFVGVRLCAGRVYICAANITTGGTALTESSTAGAVPFVGSPWTVQIGGYTTPGFEWEGAINFLITNDGSSADAITDRFNAGAGMALAGDDGWLARHGKNLVLHVGGNAAGTAIQADTYSAATDMLAGTATGRVDLSSGNYLTTADPGAGADGLTAASWGIAWESDEVAVSPGMLGRWDDADNQFFVRRIAAIGLRVYVASDGADGGNYGSFAVAHVAGTQYKGIVTYNAGTLALYYATHDPVTGRYGAVTTVAPSVTGVIPVALRSSALGYRIGHENGTSVFDGKLDDVRIWNGKCLTAAEAAADLINEPNPAGLTYWWPFDGNGTEMIAGLTATWTGTPAYVDDGRHGKGSMERWTKAGAYAFLVGGDKIVTADPGAGADGIAQCTWELYFTAAALDSGVILMRMDGADNQFAIVETATGLRVYVADAGADAANYVSFPITGYAAGQKYKATVVYDGSLAAGARLAVYAKALEAESGRYQAQTTPTPAVTGTIGTTLRASALGYGFGYGPGFGNTDVCLVLDEARIWYGVALSSAEADAESIYTAPVKAGCSHRWDFDGDAVDSIAALNGTATGALQWYDGRQPADLTLSGVEGIGRARYLARKTFSRAGVATYYDGVDYLTRTAPAGHLRDNHSWTANDGVTYRTTALGRAYTNLVSSDDFDAGWDDSDTCPVTSGVSDPMGGTGAYTLTDNNAAAAASRMRTVAFTGNGVKSGSVTYRQRTGTQQTLGIWDATAADFKWQVQVTWSAGGVPTVTPVVGLALLTVPAGFGYYTTFFQTAAITAASTNRARVYPDSAAVAAVGSVDIYRFDCYNDAVPPQDILNASEVRAADSFVDAYTPLPQEMNGLYEGLVGDLPNQGTVRTFLNLGNGTGAEAAVRLYYEAATARLVIAYHNGVSEVTGYWTVTLAMSDRISVRWHQTALGAIDAVGLKVNALAEDTTLDGAFGGTLALPAAWNAAQVVYAGTNATANSAATKFVTASGAEKTLAQLQALLETDAACLYLYVPGQYGSKGTYSMWLENAGAAGYAHGSATPTAGLWQMFRSDVREILHYAGIYTTAGGNHAYSPAAANALATVARGVRETSTELRYDEAYTENEGGFGYFDNLTWAQLPLTTPSTATKGGSLPGLSGFGNAVGVANATIVDWDAEAPTSPDVFDVAMASSGLQRVTKFDTGPSGTSKRAYRMGLSGQLNGLTPGSWYSAVVGVFIPTTSAITASHVTLKFTDTAGTTAGESADAKGVWQWLHVQRQVDAGATEAYVELCVEDSVAFGTANAYCYLAMPTVVAGRVRCVPIPNDGEGTVAKAAETNVDAYVVPSSRALTWYLKLRENGQAYAVAEGLLSRIDDGATAPGLRIFAGGAQRYRVEYSDGTTTAEVALSPSVTMGQQVEILVTYAPTTGVITASVSVAGGTETSGTDTGGANPAAWTGAYVRKGPGGAFDWLDEKIALGAHDMAAMREAT